jgi:hypothetical protein
MRNTTMNTDRINKKRIVTCYCATHRSKAIVAHLIIFLSKIYTHTNTCIIIILKTNELYRNVFELILTNANGTQQSFMLSNDNLRLIEL